MWTQIASQITQVTGQPFEGKERRSVSGGCINQATAFSDGLRTFFVKFNEAVNVAMFEAEAMGLNEIDKTRTIRVPRPVCWGTESGSSYLVLEWLELGPSNAQAWEAMGKQLAGMHRVTSNHGFGWHQQNTIGATPQVNSWKSDWAEFFSEHRIGYQLNLAKRRGAHSLHLGVGVFDGMMAYWNHDHYYVHRQTAHLDRLRNGAIQMGLRFSWSNEDLQSGVLALLDQVPTDNYYIRPIVYRSGPQLNFNDAMPVDVAILGVRTVRDVDKPLTCHISQFERVSGRAIPITWKICGTYVNSYLARRAAETSGFNDALMLDQEGRITEATAANLFLLQKDTVVTPALTPNIFPGITRSLLLEVAQSLGIAVVERDIWPQELGNFDGAFLAATMMELKPLASVHPYQYDSSNHPIFRCFLKEFQEITHQ